MASGSLERCHFSTLYRFLSRAIWEPDALSKKLVLLLVEMIDSKEIEISVDDTLCHRTGARFFGAGMHHDGASSSRGGINGPSPCFAFGHNWVVMAIKLPLPWGERRAIAIPVLFRLYRSKKLCPEEKYSKRTELAREMLELMRATVPRQKRLILAGDSEYACQTLLKDLPSGIDFVGPIHKRAALHGPVKKYRGKGRPRKKGAREASPEERFGRKGGKWKRAKVWIYGRTVTLEFKVFTTHWTKALGDRPIKLILTRDPSGRLADRAYFTTDLRASVRTTLERMAGRWLIEVSFRDLKQLFGMGDAQNGWGRGIGPREKTPGADPLGTKGEHAIRRTAPLAGFVYAIVVITYIKMDRADSDVAEARKAAPWHTSKSTPSVVNMLAALRRDLLARRLSPHPEDRSARAKILRLLPWDLMAAA
ncbi:hypothetical protein Poly30_45870 [Planctomycetes bacterium Poly30]|uniref:Transposase IS701-like DDE domain-containing protein n=2 Tax=Saltatorellus ferox TaxID=2528018 RepID=A0A518EY73_9BACT|nr:hypothetical protein Poly30_45870 [Planctomycetes bacterium Poly30]